MKRTMKWTVLAVAIAAASAAQAENYETIIVWDEDVTVDDTRNYETNTTTTNTTVNDTTNLNYTDNYTSDVTYTDNFTWNTAINEAFNLTVNEEYNATVNQTLDQSLTTDETWITYDEQVNVDSNIERDEHNVSVSLSKDLSLTSDINFYGEPTLSGDIEIDSAAIAVVDNRQSVTQNIGLNDRLTNGAAIADDTASEAEGNLAFNVAAGDNNVQDNAAALSAADASFAFGLADAEVFVNQQGSGNLTANWGVTNAASVSGNAFAGASGNIGVNVTSGNNNAQKNALAASVATSAYAQSSVSSNQISSGNAVGNAPQVEEVLERIDISLSGNVSGTTASSGTGNYSGTGAAYQQDNFYLDSWDGELDHPSGDSTGHLDMDMGIQNAVENPLRDGVQGGIAFDTEEEGELDFEEMGTADLDASLTGSVVYQSSQVVAAAVNSATLSGSAFSGASGNIGVNVSAGTGNLQANSLSMAVAQPSTAPTGGGGGSE